MDNNLITEEEKPVQNDDANVCPECGTELSVHQGHCWTCEECGWSLCGL